MTNPEIMLQSYQLKNRKWIPKVDLIFHEGKQTDVKPRFWDKKFDTKQEANKYALSQVKIYIKNNY